MSYLFGLAHNGASGLAELTTHCHDADMDVDAVLAEMQSTPDILQLVRDGDIDVDVYPLSVQLLKKFRTSKIFTEKLAAKMSLGSEAMKDIGNVYCAALPAWIAAGLEEAAAAGNDLEGGRILAVGYGSGDAAEAIPMTLANNWQKAAHRIGFSDALEPQQNLTQAQYESLHDTGKAAGLIDPEDGFLIESVGSSANPNFSDEGIEYYRYLR